LSILYTLVLAAGLGSRFGGRKLLSPWRGGVLLDGALGVALDSPTQAVFLVTGADAVEVAAAARSFAQERLQDERLNIVTARDYAQGLSASLKSGLAALPSDTSGALVFLGDMPDGAVAAAPIHRGRRGNPVGLSRALFSALSHLDGDQGARTVLDGLGPGLALVETEDDGVLIDVDHPGEAPA
jgi:molybdenum cofactor cytidylyltransferase